MRIELSEHVCGRGPSEADAPPNGDGVGEGCTVAVGVGMEIFAIEVCPACGEDDVVHAVRSNISPVSMPMRDRCLIFIVVTPVAFS